MGVSSQTRSGALAEVLASERKMLSEQMRVALPGIIQSFDPESLTAVCSASDPLHRARQRRQQSTKDYPLLVDVPVVFPRGGGCTLTFPLAKAMSVW